MHIEIGLHLPLPPRYVEKWPWQEKWKYYFVQELPRSQNLLGQTAERAELEYSDTDHTDLTTSTCELPKTTATKGRTQLPSIFGSTTHLSWEIFLLFVLLCLLPHLVSFSFPLLFSDTSPSLQPQFTGAGASGMLWEIRLRKMLLRVTTLTRIQGCGLLGLYLDMWYCLDIYYAIYILYYFQLLPLMHY